MISLCWIPLQSQFGYTRWLNRWKSYFWDCRTNICHIWLIFSQIWAENACLPERCIYKSFDWFQHLTQLIMHCVWHYEFTDSSDILCVPLLLRIPMWQHNTINIIYMREIIGRCYWCVKDLAIRQMSENAFRRSQHWFQCEWLIIQANHHSIDYSWMFPLAVCSYSKDWILSLLQAIRKHNTLVNPQWFHNFAV